MLLQPANRTGEVAKQVRGGKAGEKEGQSLASGRGRAGRAGRELPWRTTSAAFDIDRIVPHHTAVCPPPPDSHTLRHTTGQAQVLQTLSIIIQNVRSETGTFFLFSNNHINAILDLDYDWSDEEVLGYYVSFLKTISLKLNPGAWRGVCGCLINRMC